MRYFICFILLFSACCTYTTNTIQLCKNDNKLIMSQDAKIYVAGHNGLVGSALLRELQKQGYHKIITRTSKELDLRDQQAVNNFFASERPEYVFLSAATVGGIIANSTRPAEFVYNNIMIEANIIHASYVYQVKKLLFLGSSCIYPRDCQQPIKEEYLLSGPLEETNKSYALAKITGLTMCHSYNKQYGTKFISCMPTNLYGPNDNFNLINSHVIPGLINRLMQAHQENKNEVICWGTGKALREFMHVNDFACAAIFIMNNFQDYDIISWINVGSGQEISISELIHTIKEIIGFKGKIVFDATKPDGTPRKLLSTERINALGWQPKIPLYQGLKEVINWYAYNTIKQ